MAMTATERLLADLCDRSFLRLWSYANPHKDDGHEFCDVLAVFEDHVFIFFDRAKQLPDLLKDGDCAVQWERWKRSVIEAQTKTAHGAERYLRSGREIYLDAKRKRPFPIPLNPDSMIIHKIIVAHGASEACQNFSNSNIHGSLAISYGIPAKEPSFPFMIVLDKYYPIHVFDSHNLPIIFQELDTVADFSAYLDAKIDAIRSYDLLLYCGEEDLLAHYWMNFDRKANRHFIGVKDFGYDTIMVGEGEWKDFIARPTYKETKRANQSSYLWDEIINRTCDNWLQGTLLGDSDMIYQRSAILEMAKEPRFMRRIIVDRIHKSIEAFPNEGCRSFRQLSFYPSFYQNKGYVFLQLWVPPERREDEASYRAMKQYVLGIACGIAKNKMPHLSTVIGIAIEPPKLTDQIGEDFVFMDCSEWTDTQRQEFEQCNKDFRFFKDIKRNRGFEHASEFVQPRGPVGMYRTGSVGRNEPCPCGSGKKYKKCCGA